LADYLSPGDQKDFNPKGMGRTMKKSKVARRNKGGMGRNPTKGKSRRGR
jgi:hypothetical protein